MQLKSVFKLMLLVILSINLSNASLLTELYGTEGQADEKLKGMVEKLETIGFTATTKNEHIETHYYNEFKEKNLDLLNFYTILDKKSLRELLIKNPDFGAYAPFNLLAFKKFDKEKGGDTTWYGHLNSETMLNIIGEKDKIIRKKFSNMVAKVDKLIQDEMKPTTSRKLTFDKKLPNQPLLKMVKKFKEVDDIEEYVEEFIMQHDTIFGKNKFIIAGFIDLKFEYDDMELDFDAYDAYWVSSLCHFQFSNSVFNHGSPHAGIFAPCSIYFYIPKGSNELHVGYATVENWIISTGITEREKIEYMQKIANDIIKIFKQLGFTIEEEKSEKLAEANITSKDLTNEIAEIKAIILKMTKDIEELKKERIDSRVESTIKEKESTVAPKISTPVITSTHNHHILDRSIKFSKRVPPNYINSSERYKKDGTGASLSHSNKIVGDINKGRISAYLRGDLIDVDKAITKLKNAGFEVLVAEPIDNKKELVSIVFTSNKLKKLATQSGYMGTLRVLIDQTNRQISITNPLYIAKAFIQDNFDDTIPKKILSELNQEFHGLRNSLDKLKFQLLPKYQFMKGLAFYKDMITIAKGSDLLQSIESNKKRVSFILNLEDGSTLIGVKLSKYTKKFPKKIGVNNSALLPYPLLIKNGEAKILDPKYYLSLMYPQLKMEGFMKIASIPDAIINDCKKLFK
jgi:hypothetical protein